MLVYLIMGIIVGVFSGVMLLAWNNLGKRIKLEADWASKVSANRQRDIISLFEYYTAMNARIKPLETALLINNSNKSKIDSLSNLVEQISTTIMRLQNHTGIGVQGEKKANLTK